MSAEAAAVAAEVAEAELRSLMDMQDDLLTAIAGRLATRDWASFAAVSKAAKAVAEGGRQVVLSNEGGVCWRLLTWARRCADDGPTWWCLPASPRYRHTRSATASPSPPSRCLRASSPLWAAMHSTDAPLLRPSRCPAASPRWATWPFGAAEPSPKCVAKGTRQHRARSLCGLPRPRPGDASCDRGDQPTCAQVTYRCQLEIHDPCFHGLAMSVFTEFCRLSLLK